MSYDERFGSNRTTTTRQEKPPCFGDEYEEDHPDCLACPVRRGCKVLTAQRDRRKAAERQRTQKTTNRPNRGNRGSSRTTSGRQLPARRHTTSTALEEVDHGEDVSFFGALAINAGLSSVGAGLKEAQYAVDSIPRVAYPDPLAAAIRRGKKRAQEE